MSCDLEEGLRACGKDLWHIFMAKRLLDFSDDVVFDFSMTFG